MRHYYAAFSGGLGDVLLTLYRGAYFGILSSSRPVDVFLSSHNPHARELFDSLPPSVTLRNLGWPSELARRTDRGLSPELGLLPLPLGKHGMTFHPSPEDMAAFADIEGHPAFTGWERVVVFAPGAGTPDRNVPSERSREFLDSAIAAGWLPVVVGKSYKRGARFEPIFLVERATAIHLKDGLSVPGVGRLVQECGAVVASHSAVSMLAWLEGKKNVLLYPASVREAHFKYADAYSFGLFHPETLALQFDEEYSSDLPFDFFTSDPSGWKK